MGRALCTIVMRRRCAESLHANPAAGIRFGLTRNCRLRRCSLPNRSKLHKLTSPAFNNHWSAEDQQHRWFAPLHKVEGVYFWGKDAIELHSCKFSILVLYKIYRLGVPSYCKHQAVQGISYREILLKAGALSLLNEFIS